MGKNNYLKYQEPPKNSEDDTENPVNFVAFIEIIIQCTIKATFPKMGKNTRNSLKYNLFQELILDNLEGILGKGKGLGISGKCSIFRGPERIFPSDCISSGISDRMN